MSRQRIVRREVKNCEQHQRKMVTTASRIIELLFLFLHHHGSTAGCCTAARFGGRSRSFASTVSRLRERAGLDPYPLQRLWDDCLAHLRQDPQLTTHGDRSQLTDSSQLQRSQDGDKFYCPVCMSSEFTNDESDSDLFLCPVKVRPADLSFDNYAPRDHDANEPKKVCGHLFHRGCLRDLVKSQVAEHRREQRRRGVHPLLRRSGSSSFSGLPPEEFKCPCCRAPMGGWYQDLRRIAVSSGDENSSSGTSSGDEGRSSSSDNTSTDGENCSGDGDDTSSEDADDGGSDISSPRFSNGFSCAPARSSFLSNFEVSWFFPCAARVGRESRGAQLSSATPTTSSPAAVSGQADPFSFDKDLPGRCFTSFLPIEEVIRDIEQELNTMSTEGEEEAGEGFFGEDTNEEPPGEQVVERGLVAALVLLSSEQLRAISVAPDPALVDRFGELPTALHIADRPLHETLRLQEEHRIQQAFRIRRRIWEELDRRRRERLMIRGQNLAFNDLADAEWSDEEVDHADDINYHAAVGVDSSFARLSHGELRYWAGADLQVEIVRPARRNTDGISFHGGERGRTSSSSSSSTSLVTPSLEEQAAAQEWVHRIRARLNAELRRRESVEAQRENVEGEAARIRRILLTQVLFE